MKAWIPYLKHKTDIWGLFSFFQSPIVREIRTTVRIRWSFPQMCYAMSLVCPSIATHRTCQLWARNEPVNLSKTIVSRKTWSACCNSIPLFRTSDEKCCPQVLSFFMALLGSTLQLQQRGSWSVFDGKCMITKAENYMPSGVVRFMLWLWEWTACRCKNIDLRICSEIVWTGLYDKVTR